MLCGMPDPAYPTLAKAPAVPLDKIEWRVDGQPVSRNGGGHASRFVPYIDAAIVADLLDEWVGPGRWSDRYEPGELAGKSVLWCHLSIEVQPGVWVTHSDVGKPSNFEAEKGTVSDAFKRAACLKWGAGRNVYDVPGDLWAPCRTYTSNGKTYAQPNDDTIPALMRQLKERGYSTDGLRVAGSSEPEDATPEPTRAAAAKKAGGTAKKAAGTTKKAAANTNIDDTKARTELLESFQALPDEIQTKVLERLHKAGTIVRESAGAIGTIDAAQFDTVRRTLDAAHKSVQQTPQAAAAGDGGAGAGAASPPSPPAGVTATGEVWSIEQLIEGIDHNENLLNEDQMTEWGAWLETHLAGRNMLDLDHPDVLAAFSHVSTIAAGGAPT